jgi:hypothetical protein
MHTDENFVLSFSESQYRLSTQTKDDDREDVSYCLAFSSKNGNKVKDLVRVVLDPYEFEVKRSACHVEPDPLFVCKLYNTLRKEEANSVVQLHWHKFSSMPEFSSLDDRCAELLLADITRFNPQIRVIQVVFGKRSEHFKARYTSKTGKFTHFDELEIIGPKGIRLLPEKHAQVSEFMADEIFEKNVLAFGKAGVDKIHNTSVAVVGAGGIGSGLLYQMARIGFRRVSVIDFDKIEATNCNRQYFIAKPSEAVGKQKANFIKNVYKQFNPKAEIECYNGPTTDLQAQAILKRADLIILAVDNDAARAVVNSFCARYAKPLVNVTTGIKMDEGGKKIASAGTQLQWFIPREDAFPCLRCQGSLSNKGIQKCLMSGSQKKNRKQAGYVVGTNQSPAPQVMPLNGIAIGFTMWDITGWITGIRKPVPWVYYDGMQNTLIPLKVVQNPTCSCCSSNETSLLAVGDDEQILTPKVEVPSKKAMKWSWIANWAKRTKQRLKSLRSAIFFSHI